MRYVHVAEFEIDRARMRDFATAVQQWERLALGHTDGPDHHAVLVDTDEPTRVLVLTQFPDEEHARRFAESDLSRELMGAVLSCCRSTVSSRRYSVFYAAGTEGPRSIFGEVP